MMTTAILQAVSGSGIGLKRKWACCCHLTRKILCCPFAIGQRPTAYRYMASMDHAQCDCRVHVTVFVGSICSAFRRVQNTYIKHPGRDCAANRARHATPAAQRLSVGGSFLQDLANSLHESYLLYVFLQSQIFSMHIAGMLPCSPREVS